ncbi:MAG TPA: hypothetical protein VNA15_01865 [Candidatus Angelobacter sp.]|nr:hypothetical protein [Candidatus Angelobacter sp.]
MSLRETQPARAAARVCGPSLSSGVKIASNPLFDLMGPASSSEAR